MAKKPDKKAEKKAEKKPEAGAPEAGTKSGGGLIGLLMLGGAALASSFGVVYLMSPPPAAVAEACPATGDAHGEAVIEPTARADQSYVPLPEVTISVGSAPSTRLVQLKVSVITTIDGSDAVLAAEPMLIDAFNTYLRSVEMKDFEDPSFYPRMREQLSRRAELVLGSGLSKGVLITEFLLR